MSSIVNKMIRDNIQVIRSKNVKESSEFILKFQDKLLEFIESTTLTSSMTSSSTTINYVSTLKPRKKDNLNPKTVFMTQLMCIPLISHSIAEAIVSKCPNINNLIQNYQTLDIIEFELKTKDKDGNYKKRKVGKAVITFLELE